jgi:hypothetical protein
MKHSSTRPLFEYWSERRGTRAAPERADIEPGPIRHALGDTFILSFNPAVGHPFRLAGTRLCALFCRELKSEPFVDLWARPVRQSLSELTELLGTESPGLVASASGQGPDGSAVELELLLLPLSHRGRMPARFLGVLAPLTVPYWIGVAPLADLRLGALRHLGPALQTVAAAPYHAPSARWRNGFLVVDGGRSPQS